MTGALDPRLRSSRGAGTVVTGIVVHGEARGRLLGFPTANVDPDPDSPVPADGVWVAQVQVPRWVGSVPLTRFAALSVGTNPTYGGVDLRVEAHLLDFDGDLYGRRMSVRVMDYLRRTLTFDSEDALVDQIRRDVDEVRRWRW
ncbi:riboflavin kinase [Jatrophihabitans sp. YIM 134969]